MLPDAGMYLYNGGALRQVWKLVSDMGVAPGTFDPSSSDMAASVSERAGVLMSVGESCVICLSIEIYSMPNMSAFPARIVPTGQSIGGFGADLS